MTGLYISSLCALFYLYMTNSCRIVSCIHIFIHGANENSRKKGYYVTHRDIALVKPNDSLQFLAKLHLIGF